MGANRTEQCEFNLKIPNLENYSFFLVTLIGGARPMLDIS